MRNHYLYGLLAALLVLAGGLQTRGQGEADVVLQHRETYFAEVRKLDAKYTEQRQDLDKKLADTATALEARYAELANLEGVLAAREVLAAIDDPFSEVVTPDRKNIDELKRVLDQHAERSRAIDAEETKMRDELKGKYIAYLERVKAKLTTERKIDEALAIHKEIERLNEEIRLGAKLAAPKQQPQPEQSPQPVRNPANPAARPQQQQQPPPPNPNARKFLSEAEVIEQLKTLTGSTIAFNGRVKSIENDTMTRGSFIITMEGGLKVRLAMPDNTELAKRGGATIVKAKPPMGNEDILAAGAQVAIQASVAKGVVHHATPASFLNTVLIGSDSQNVRRRFKADCGGPCPPLAQRYYNTRFCTTCGNERTDVLFYTY